MALWRILRCNPFGAGGIDQVHGSRGSESYDDVVRRAADQKARV
jgi:putative component of membrane protein insertase Oxa1/YidC/SpoIIIJ protein YidD